AVDVTKAVAEAGAPELAHQVGCTQRGQACRERKVAACRRTRVATLDSRQRRDYRLPLRTCQWSLSDLSRRLGWRREVGPADIDVVGRSVVAHSPLSRRSVSSRLKS